MLTKDFAVQVKAVAGDVGSDLEPGQFEAIVSVFGNKDSVGDVVVKGAFANDLKRWEESGDPIPVVWAHKWEDPFAHVGYALEAKETDEGLYIKGQLDIDGDNPTALQVYRLLKGRRVKQFSFAYDVLEGGYVDKKGADGQPEGFYELRELKTYEVGPCLVGANQETELLAAKALQLEAATAGAKAGRVLSAKNLEGLKTARAAIDAVIAAQEGDDEEGKATTAETADTKTTEGDQPTGNDDKPSQLGDANAKAAKAKSVVSDSARRVLAAKINATTT